jgi:hypothetical protein
MLKEQRPDCRTEAIVSQSSKNQNQYGKRERESDEELPT